ncbi:Ubiquitin-conjugating enzyme E2 20 [Acorus calamus]|uniref:Ubiquitin-conjugating enzyme E2 20 n=1 Tax=Acorus calamus TaxID=4465 RepID=A0AAV9CTG9_ACOCL|nr:Ubiquitin-conjugating enzyme E2 20 [Acorus calamus]
MMVHCCFCSQSDALHECIAFSFLTSRYSSSSRLRVGLGICLSVQFVCVDSLSPASIHPYPGEPVAISLSSTVFRRLDSSPESTAGLLRLVRSISLWIIGSCRFIDHECKRSEGLLHSHSPLLQVGPLLPTRRHRRHLPRRHVRYVWTRGPQPNNDSPLNTQAAALWSNQEEYKKMVEKLYKPA